MPSVSASSRFSKSFADANASTPTELSVNLPRSAPPAASAGIDHVRSATGVSASVAVSVATAVWFSTTVKLAALVMTGGWGFTVTVTVSSWNRPPASVTRSVNVKAVASVTAGGAVKVAVAVVSSFRSTVGPPVCVQR